uniref:Zinc-finger domain-containing protein n=1 Tax=Moniliophthora roreri TaxID=221103 RepID=A0A0W0EYA7_MONRR
MPSFTPSETANAASHDISDSCVVTSSTSSQDQNLVTPSNCIPRPDHVFHYQSLTTTRASSSSQTAPVARAVTPPSAPTPIPSQTSLFTPPPSPKRTRKALMLSHVAVPSFPRGLRPAHYYTPLLNLRDSPKKPRTPRVPKALTTHNNLPDAMNSAWAHNWYPNSGERRVRKPPHLTGTVTSLSGMDFGDELEDGDFEASLGRSVWGKKSPKRKKRKRSSSSFSDDSAEPISPIRFARSFGNRVVGSDDDGEYVGQLVTSVHRSKKARTGHCSWRKPPPENDVPKNTAEIGEEDGEYSLADGSEETPIVGSNPVHAASKYISSISTGPTPSNVKSTDNLLPLNDEIFDYYNSTKNADELTISFDDLTGMSLHGIKSDAISLFNARFTRSEGSRYDPIVVNDTDSDSHESLATTDVDAVRRSRCLIPIKRRHKYGGDDPITYSVRPSSKSESDNVSQTSRLFIRIPRRHLTKVASRSDTGYEEKARKNVKRRESQSREATSGSSFTRNATPDASNRSTLDQLSWGSISTPSSMSVVSDNDDVVTRPSAKSLGKRKAVPMDDNLFDYLEESPALEIGMEHESLYREYDDDGWDDHDWPVPNHGSPPSNTSQFLQTGYKPTFSSIPSYPQPLSEYPDFHDATPFLSSNPSSPLNSRSIPQPTFDLVKDQNTLLGINLSRHGTDFDHEELDASLDQSYSPFAEGEDPVVRQGVSPDVVSMPSSASNGTIDPSLLPSLDYSSPKEESPDLTNSHSVKVTTPAKEYFDGNRLPPRSVSRVISVKPRPSSELKRCLAVLGEYGSSDNEEHDGTVLSLRRSRTPEPELDSPMEFAQIRSLFHDNESQVESTVDTSISSFDDEYHDTSGYSTGSASSAQDIVHGTKSEAESFRGSPSPLADQCHSLSGSSRTVTGAEESSDVDLNIEVPTAYDEMDSEPRQGQDDAGEDGPFAYIVDMLPQNEVLQDWTQCRRRSFKVHFACENPDCERNYCIRCIALRYEDIVQSLRSLALFICPACRDDFRGKETTPGQKRTAASVPVAPRSTRAQKIAKIRALEIINEPVEYWGPVYDLSSNEIIARGFIKEGGSEDLIVIQPVGDNRKKRKQKRRVFIGKVQRCWKLPHSDLDGNEMDSEGSNVCSSAANRIRYYVGRPPPKIPFPDGDTVPDLTPSRDHSSMDQAGSPLTELDEEGESSFRLWVSDEADDEDELDCDVQNKIIGHLQNLDKAKEHLSQGQGALQEISFCPDSEDLPSSLDDRAMTSVIRLALHAVGVDSRVSSGSPRKATLSTDANMEPSQSAL